MKTYIVVSIIFCSKAENTHILDKLGIQHWGFFVFFCFVLLLSNKTERSLLVGLSEAIFYISSSTKFSTLSI